MLAYGVGALNINATRIPTQTGEELGRNNPHGPYQSERTWSVSNTPGRDSTGLIAGRWPPNTLLSHHPDCAPIGTRQVRSGTAGPKSRAWKAGGEGLSTWEAHASETYAAPDGTETIPAWACVPGCPVAILDAQSGVSTSSKDANRFKGRKKFNGTKYAGDSYSLNMESGEVAIYGDTGGASRFYPILNYTAADFLYCAKSSRRERNAGCEGLPERVGTLQGDFQDHRPHTREGYEYHRAPMGNHHSTVKPVRLMEWLCTLITPPGGTILDPFAGSGTTGVAAVHLGYSFIGMEQEPDYFEIAQARILHAAEQPPDRPVSPRPKRTKQPAPVAEQLTLEGVA